MAQLKSTSISGDLAVKGNIVANNFYPVGSVFITSTRISPGDKSMLNFGTWKLIDKEFKPDSEAPISGSKADLYFTKNSGVKSSFTLAYVRSGHTVRLRLDLPPNANWEFGTDITLGTVRFDSLGINKNIIASFKDHPGGNEVNHSVMLCSLDNDSGALVRKEIVKYNFENGKAAGTATLQSSTAHWDFTITLTPDFMLDSFCNKFYWERTA